MTRRGVVTMIVIGAVAIGATAWELHKDNPPSCTSEQALNAVSTALHDRYELDSIFLNDIRTVRGNWFSSSFDCRAEETVIAGNRNMEDLPWRAVHYKVMHLDGVPNFAVVAELDGPTPFVRDKLSFWQRLFSGR